MPNQLRSGIVGGEFIGGVHAYAVRAAGGRLTRVADHSPQAALEAAERLGAEAAANSSADLIAAEDVDVVHICTPNATHAQLARPPSRPARPSSARSRWHHPVGAPGLVDRPPRRA